MGIDSESFINAFIREVDPSLAAPVPVRVVARYAVHDTIEFRVLAGDGRRLGQSLFMVDSHYAVACDRAAYFNDLYDRLHAARDNALDQYIIDCSSRGDWPEMQVLIDLVHETGVEILTEAATPSFATKTATASWK